MKYLYLFFILMTLYASAEETSIQNRSIDQLLTEVKKSKGDARRQAMNRLKIKLRSVNQQTRQQVIMQLRKRFNSGHTVNTSMQYPHQRVNSGARRQPAHTQQTHGGGMQQANHVQHLQAPSSVEMRPNAGHTVVPQHTPSKHNIPHTSPHGKHGGHP